jgi:hypothetical protein
VLNVSVSWIYEHTRDDAEDRLPFVKLGKYLRFDRGDLRAYIDAKRASARTAHRKRRRRPTAQVPWSRSNSACGRKRAPEGSREAARRYRRPNDRERAARWGN